MTLQPIPFVLLLLALVIELCRGASISGCIADERNALLNLKKNVEDKHSRLASWKDEDCCNWDGVSCNNVTGHVVRLDLRNPHPCSEIDIELAELFADEYIAYNDFIQCKEWSLRGHLSPSLVGLKQLNYLDLSINQFDGHIPKFLGSLHNLRYLNLSLAGFHGLIPHHLGNLSRLKYLHLDNLDLNDNGYGIIDDSRWISRLTSLKHLTMTYIKFENFQNWIEALNELPNIVEIRLSYCNINGFPLSLPYVNFTNLSYLDLSYLDLPYLDLFDNPIEMIPLWLFNIKSLTHIDLSGNFFNSIPDALKNLTSSIEYIDFSFNKFSGALPQALKSLRKVHTLDLSFNNLDRSLPNWLGELHMLKSLNLSGNNINGSLPNWLGELHRLESLDLSGNGLFGCIPESLGRLVALQELDLSSNNLNGTVPESIGQLSNLVSLSLDNNFFGGVISEVHFASLAKLKVLYLESNNLILNVSRDWIPPFKLNILGMGSCKIGPEFPRWLQTQVNLSSLDLSSSHIVDFLPHSFWNVFTTHDTCIWLDLSNNGINGSLPHLPKFCFEKFNLSSNFFSGPLPPTLNITKYLDISRNSFYGPINPFICNTNPLNEMSLSQNNFNGKIPSCICQLTNVKTLDFSRNLLTDELPDCWGAYKGIELLDFSGNNLSGNIPHTLGTLTNLVILRLDNNIFSGNIPHTLGTLTNLEILHLNNNILSGNIPSTFKNCTQLMTFDLSFNHLNGQIPIWFGENLNILRALVLRSNNFTGNIPANLGKLKLLQILNLGNNNLIGRIPRSFGNFTNMIDIHQDDEFDFIDSLQLLIKGKEWMYHELLSLIRNIDLSCNKLSGQIPTEIGNLRVLNFLNLSENHLVGSIPDEIGLMHSLESLDMSKNGLFGNIPLSMATMTTLDVLNLSYNNLSGKIPSGNQLQTFTNKSYIGNPELCGFPLTQSCDSNKTTNVEVSVDEVIESDYWYVSIALGFVLGFWIVWVILFLKKKWKDAYFRYVDYVYDAIFVAIAVNINRFKRKLGNEIASG